MSITKFGKKLCCLLALFAMVFTFVSCQTTVNPEKEENRQTATLHADDIHSKLFWDASAMVDITDSLTLVTSTKYEDTKVQWASNEPEIISPDGTVTRPMADHPNAVGVPGTEIKDENDTVTGYAKMHVEVKLTATITSTYHWNENGEEKTDKVVKTKEFKFTVLCLDEGLHFGTIKEVKDAAYQYIYVENKVPLDHSVNNNSVVYSVGFYGVVTAKLNANGTGQFMVHDGTEGIYVYSKPEDLQVGDTVLVYGEIYSYYATLQVGSNITVTVVEDRGIEVPEYTEKTVADWEENYKLGMFGGQLYSIYARLEAGTSAHSGDAYKLVDPFTADVAWIYSGSYSAEQEAVLKSYVGKYVNITGVSYGRDSRCNKNHLLWDGGIEEAAAPELTDEQKANQVKSLLEALAGEYVSGAKFAFPTTYEDYNATVAWNIPTDAPYDVEKGQFTLVNADTKFTATATITVNGVVVPVDVEITVKKIATMTVSQAIAAAKDTVVKLEGTIEAVFGSKGYYYLKDATGTILVYVATNAGITVNGVTYNDVKPGDTVTLIGAVGNFNGTPQIASVLSYEAYAAGEWNQTRPQETTWQAMKDATSTTAPYGQYLMLTGVIVSDGSYFLFNESTADGAVSISLYNSNVPEKVKAVADTDTTVTLLFYFYGNSKGDYTGATRVIFCGRDGEYFVGDEPVVLPDEKDYQTVKEAKALAASAAAVTLEAVITAVGSYSEQYGNFHILLQDETGAIIAYRVKATAEEYATLKVGDLVRISGNAKLSNGQYQLTGVTFKDITVKTNDNPVPTVVDVTDVDPSTFVDYQSQIVKVTGLVKAVPTWGTGSGATLKLNVNNETVNVYVHKTDFPNANVEEVFAQLKVNQEVTVTGYMNWYNAAQVTPVNGKTNFVLGEVKDPEPLPSGVYTFAYAGGTTTNMTGGNDAALVGLKADLFTVVGAKNGNSNFPGLNKNGDCRLYGNPGTTVEVTSLNGNIKTITIEFVSGYSAGCEVLVNGTPVEAVDGVYTINAASFTLRNGNSDTTQVRFNSVTITLA